MSKDFKRLLSWMTIIAALAVFIGTNTYLTMYEYVDTFERKRAYVANKIVEQKGINIVCETGDCEEVL